MSRTRKTMRTPLMAAAQGGHTPAVLLLLKHAPTLPSAAGGQAVAASGGEAAAAGGEAAAAAGGEAAAAHINERDAQGHTALMLAAKNAHAQTCAALLRLRLGLGLG